jgi:flagellar hook-length control protein FliK
VLGRDLAARKPAQATEPSDTRPARTASDTEPVNEPSDSRTDESDIGVDAGAAVVTTSPSNTPSTETEPQADGGASSDSANTDADGDASTEPAAADARGDAIAEPTQQPTAMSTNSTAGSTEPASGAAAQQAMADAALSAAAARAQAGVVEDAAATQAANAAIDATMPAQRQSAGQAMTASSVIAEDTASTAGQAATGATATSATVAGAVQSSIRPAEVATQPVARDAARTAADAQRDLAQQVSTQAADGSAQGSAGKGGDAAGGQQGGSQGNPQRGLPQHAAASQNQSRADQAMSAVSQAFGQPAPTATRSSGATDAVAGRLSEVETSVARERIAASIEQGILSINTSAGNGMAAATTETMGGAVNATAFGAAMTSASAQNQTLSGTLGAPAADLAQPTLDPAPTGRLAAKGLDILSNQRGGAITMRLEPPALGQVRIELRVSHGAVVADFMAATPEARVLLEANLGMLRERLESQGLAVERMSVHGGRGTEAAPVANLAQGGDLRQDSNGSGADARDRGERSGGRQDAADGESRGRRDDERGSERDGRGERGQKGGFLGVLEAQRSQDAGRRMRRAV